MSRVASATCSVVMAACVVVVVRSMQASERSVVCVDIRLLWFVVCVDIRFISTWFLTTKEKRKKTGVFFN